MNKDLLGIVELQKLDLLIAELSQSKQEFPEEVKKLAGIISEAEALIAAADKKSAQLEVEHKNVLEQITTAKESLAKSEQRLNSISTNREYDAVHNEIGTHKQSILSGESRTKSFSQETEKLTSLREEAVKESERVKTENQPKIDELTAKIASVDADIAAVTEKRAAILPTINKNILRNYEHILKRRKNGKVVSFISASDRSCLVCHKILEAQLINEVRKGSKVILCESCGSILIWNSPETGGQSGDSTDAA